MNVIHVQTEESRRYADIDRCPGEGDLGCMASRHGKKVPGSLDATTLALTGTRYRFGLGYSEPNTWYNTDLGTRAFTDEPVGFTFGLGSCIAANPEMSTAAEIRRQREAGYEFDVAHGDVLVTDRQYAFKVVVVRREFIHLEYLGPWHLVRSSL